MSDLKWLEFWTGQTVDELITLEGRYRLDSIVLAFEQALQHKPADRLSQPEIVILAVESFEREVNNGGYSQFFENDPGFAPIIVDALTSIGCTTTASLTQEALRALGVEKGFGSKDVAAAISQADPSRDELLDRCDQRYFRDVSDVAGALFEYIKQHRRAISFS